MPKNIKTIKKPSLAPQDATLKANMYKGGSSRSTSPNQGAVGLMRSALPINAATFVQDLTGNKTPITTGNISAREKDVLRGAARNAKSKGRSNINYQNYNSVGTNDSKTTSDLLDAVNTPEGRMKTTIGGATLKIKGASTVLTDSFDFGGLDNQDYKDAGSPTVGSSVKKIAKSIPKLIKGDESAGGDIYSGLKNTASAIGSQKDGKGIPVEIDLGNLKRPTKTENEKGLYMKGTKKVKAANGLQSVAVPEQGSVSNVLSSTTSLASTGAQFGPWGAAAGAVVGLGMGLIQKRQQDRANKLATRKNKFLQANRAYAAVDESIDQKAQRFTKGGKVKGTIIEIEGKKAPEIHTDKNFNLKNLGVTPHSKGGDLVHAEDGDVVFNTQNSLTKYNKIANAIQEGDIKTLKKEQDKLPEDTGMKAQDGKKKVISKRDQAILDASRPQPRPTKRIYDTETWKTLSPKLKAWGSQTRALNVNPAAIPVAKPTPKPVKIDNTPASFKTPFVPTIPKFATNPMKGFTGKPGVVPESPSKPTSKPKAVSTKPRAKSPAKVAPFTPNKPTIGAMGMPDLSGLGDTSTKVSGNVAGELFNKNSDSTPKPITETLDSTIGAGVGKAGKTASNLMQFAGVANNIIQGLKPEKPIAESYLQPEQIKYTDRSESLRQQSTNAAVIQGSNARNLAGGNAGNVRANQVVAQAGNLQRQGAIDEQEMGRRDNIEAQNVGLRNQANQYNLQRKDMYEGQYKQDRLRKQEYIDTAAADIGQYGMAQREESYLRSRDDKMAAAQEAGYQSINGRFQHKSNRDGSTYFEPDADTSITRFGQNGRMRRKPGIFAAGTKAVKTSKYKMK